LLMRLRAITSYDAGRRQAKMVVKHWTTSQMISTIVMVMEGSVGAIFGR
jgi:hypothetical protein